MPSCPPHMQCVTVVSAPSRLTHDISLEEFEDEDLSEITDECGISLHCKESLAARVGAWDGDRDGIPRCAHVFGAGCGRRGTGGLLQPLIWDRPRAEGGCWGTGTEPGA